MGVEGLRLYRLYRGLRFRGLGVCKRLEGFVRSC